MTTTLYGIKNCDTVKKARKWLEANDIDYTFHDFRVEGITTDLVNNWLSQQPVEKLVNKRSTTWKQLDEAGQQQALDSNSTAAVCVENETLVKRPVLDHEGQVHLGFSDKTYSSIFNV